MVANLITRSFSSLDGATSFLSEQNPVGVIAVIVVLGYPLSGFEDNAFGEQLAEMNCGYIIIHGDSAYSLELTIDQAYVTACVDGLQEPKDESFITVCADDDSEVDEWLQFCVEKNEYSDIYVLRVGVELKQENRT